jgi:hypothetical protein
MTTKEYLKRCDEINATISQLRRIPNPNKGLYWLSERNTITAPKTKWDKMIDELQEQKKMLKLKRDHSLRYGYGFAN